MRYRTYLYLLERRLGEGGVKLMVRDRDWLVNVGDLVLFGVLDGNNFVVDSAMIVRVVVVGYSVMVFAGAGFGREEVLELCSRYGCSYYDIRNYRVELGWLSRFREDRVKELLERFRGDRYSMSLSVGGILVYLPREQVINLSGINFERLRRGYLVRVFGVRYMDMSGGRVVYRSFRGIVKNLEFLHRDIKNKMLGVN